LIIGHWLYDYFQFVTLVTQKEEALRFDNWLYPYEIIMAESCGSSFGATGSAPEPPMGLSGGMKPP